MTTLVLLEATPQPGRTQELADYYKRNFHAQGHDGFHEGSAYVSEKENVVLVIQLWDSVEAFEVYLGWRETAASVGEFSALIQGQPTIRYFESR